MEFKKVFCLIILPKIENSAENRKFSEKSSFWFLAEILAENRNFSKKSKF